MKRSLTRRKTYRVGRKMEMDVSPRVVNHISGLSKEKDDWMKNQRDVNDKELI